MSAWEVIQDVFEDEHTRAFMLWMAFMTVQPPDLPRQACSPTRSCSVDSVTAGRCRAGAPVRYPPRSRA